MSEAANWMTMALSAVDAEPEPAGVQQQQQRPLPPRAARPPRSASTRPAAAQKGPAGADVGGDLAATSVAETNLAGLFGGDVDLPAGSATPPAATEPDLTSAAGQSSVAEQTSAADPASLADLFGEVAADPSPAPAPSDDEPARAASFEDLFADPAPATSSQRPSVDASEADPEPAAPAEQAAGGQVTEAPAPPHRVAEEPPQQGPVAAPSSGRTPAPLPHQHRPTGADQSAGDNGPEDSGRLTSQVWFPAGMADALADLARTAAPEPWGTDNAWLRAYLRNTFRRLAEEGKVLTGADSSGAVAVFNTGLLTPSHQPVLAFLGANSHPDRQPWVFREWGTAASGRMGAFTTAHAEAAFYFDEPADVVFDRRLPVIANVDHIVEDNADRFPAALREDSHRRRLLLEGAVKDAAAAAGQNWRVAVPHYYRAGTDGPGRVQLLLPLCLTTPGQPDLALALERTLTHYRAHTVLTLDMASSNARLLGRPVPGWLPA